MADEDDEVKPWSHLKANKNGALLFEFENGEKEFYELFAELCPDELTRMVQKWSWGTLKYRVDAAADHQSTKGKVHFRMKKSQSSTFYEQRAPYDLFMLRTKLREWGLKALEKYRKEHGVSSICPPPPHTRYRHHRRHYHRRHHHHGRRWLSFSHTDTQ
jgi:hypothetical protein